MIKKVTFQHFETNTKKKKKKLKPLNIHEKINLYQMRPDLDQKNLMKRLDIVLQLLCNDFIRKNKKPLTLKQYHYFIDWVNLYLS